jgi:hypothetical protein
MREVSVNGHRRRAHRDDRIRVIGRLLVEPIFDTLGERRSFYQDYRAYHKRNGKPRGMQNIRGNLVVLAFDPVNDDIHETHDDESARDEPDESLGLA